MTPGTNRIDTEWMHAFMTLGSVQHDNWELRGAGVLLLDQPVVWLVTASEVIADFDGQDIVTWVKRKQDVSLLNISNSQRNSGVQWIHHPAGISATMFPVDASFAIKAFSRMQCTKIRDLQPMQPAVSLGSLMAAGFQRSPGDLPAVCDGMISTVDRNNHLIHATTPLLPRNAGAPLMLASPHGGPITIAAILLGNAVVPEVDPRVLPIRLSRAIAIDAALELIRSDAAIEQRQRLTAASDVPAAAPPTPTPPRQEQA